MGNMNIHDGTHETRENHHFPVNASEEMDVLRQGGVREGLEHGARPVRADSIREGTETGLCSKRMVQVGLKWMCNAPCRLKLQKRRGGIGNEGFQRFSLDHAARRKRNGTRIPFISESPCFFFSAAHFLSREGQFRS